MASRAFLTALLATAAVAVPLENRQNCAAQWGQCGGQGWTGPTCCPSGTTCQVGNPWYSQCLPGTGPPAPPPVTTTSSSRPVTTSSTSRPGGVTTTTTPTVTPTTTGGGSGGTTTAPPPGPGPTYTGNPFLGVTQWANSYYRSEISTLAMPSLSPALASAAAKVANVPTFQWIDTIAKIPVAEGTLADVRRANAAGGNYAAQLVVYNLPDRDCAAAASNGELAIANDGLNKYKGYIDSIRALLTKYNDLRILLVIEPDSLANMVTNLNVPKCAGAAAAYKEGTKYAITQLNLPNVAMYLDAGHAGWLGWPEHTGKAAKLFADLWKEAGRPKSVRGFATNVSNYNAWSVSSPPPYTSPNPNYDERHFVDSFGALLRNNEGWDAKFIIDQGRSGKQPTGQQQWGHWCNAVGTGFGVRPTTNTGHADVDAFVWVKPGGESDGTSDTSATRYDTFCGSPSSLKPAPEAGSWFQAYFEQLLVNANPSF